MKLTGLFLLGFTLLLASCGGPSAPPERTYQIRTARLACDFNPRITTDVYDGRLLDLAATMLQTKNGIVSAHVMPETQIVEVEYRDDRITEAGIIKEMVAYFVTYRFNISVTRVD